MSVTIRLAKNDDVAYLKKWLMDPVILRWFPMFDEREVDDSSRIWMNYIKQKAAYTLLYDGKPAAMSVLYIQAFEKLKHQSLFAIIADPEMRGKGLGSQLYNHMENDAKQNHHIRKIHLEVYDGNPAQRLYTRLGFTEYGRHEDFLKEPDGTYITKILMEKQLTE